MQMTDSEIYRSWKEAKNRDGQIEILSQLNACDKTAIKRIVMQERGKEMDEREKEVKERKKPGPKPKNPVATSQQTPEEKRAERMDKEMACEVVPDEVKKAVTIRMQHLSEEADRIHKEVMTLSAWLAGTRR